MKTKRNIIKINREYNYDIEYSFDEDEEMENSSSHESFVYAYEMLMEKKKELEGNISLTEISTGKENVLENKTMYYSSLKEPTASCTDELRTNGQNYETQRDAKISIQSPCALAKLLQERIICSKPKMREIMFQMNESIFDNG